MLIHYSKVVQICRENNIDIRGIFHVGAHECEELTDYVNNGIDKNNIVWVEGNKEISDKMKGLGIPNIINAVVDDASGNTVTFNITNNGQSSSILELGTHKIQHPHIYVSKTETVVTKSIQDIAIDHNLDFTRYNFWNFDIQGAELRALKGSGDLILYADILYLEVNSEELYKGCALIGEIDEYVATYGFKRIETNMTCHGWGDAVYIKSIQLNRCLNNCDSDSNGERWFYETFVSKRDGIIFDVGSRSDSLFCKYSGEVHYFEPVTEFINILKSTLNNGKSILNNFGLSDKNETITYYRDAQSFVLRDKSCSKFNNAITTFLDVKRGDEYVISHQINSVRFLKIDTEGYELDVLRGFNTTLSIFNTIQFEYGGTYLDRGIKLIDVINYLKLYGFNRFYYLSNFGLVSLQDFEDHYCYCNIVCLK